MERVFTENVGNYKAGDLRDYPRGVWSQIEKNVGKDLDSFTVSKEKALSLSSVPSSKRGKQ